MMPSHQLNPVGPLTIIPSLQQAHQPGYKASRLLFAICPNFSMPIVRKITGPRGCRFWASFDLEDSHLLRAIVKEEFQRAEPTDEIHYIPNRANDRPPNTLKMEISLPCLRDCLVFLYRGAIFIQGQGAITETGYAYAVQDEKWLGLDKNAIIFIMEQGAMKGICKRKTDEELRASRAQQEAHSARVAAELNDYRARRAAAEAKRNKPWAKLLRKLRREPEPETVQCATQ
ncbi:hypothetical protein CDV36_016128 [Fusarium kuroshium]|uniref:Uncharacterized protein n=2 Tax=Fusarium solani species complex TaxID=232080 RepID=A0A3M2QZN0_9HYPO|nr:hypothetical protein CDV36_016128 [Fusarium kuroshium]RSL42690.1 hypothetical protein CEP51_016452 [Fusarium floridanum]